MEDNILKKLDEIDTKLKSLGEKPSKDNLDRFSIIAPLLSGFVVAVIGLFLSYRSSVETSKANERIYLLQQTQANSTNEQAKSTKVTDRLKLAVEVREKNPDLASEFAKGTPLAPWFEKWALQATRALQATKKTTSTKDSALAAEQFQNLLAIPPYFKQIPDGGSAKGRAALQAAIGEIGQRDGRRYLKVANVPSTELWAVAFVSWCFSQVPGGSPFTASARGPNIFSEFKNKGWLHFKSRENYTPQPGDCLWRSKDGNLSTLLGIVQRFENNVVYIVTKNNGAVGGRAYPMSKDFVFGHVPD